MKPSAPRTAQGGQSLVEFTIVFPTLLLLVLGVVQFALLFVAKSTLDQAAYTGVREGTLNHGRRTAINLGIAKGLAPLYQEALMDGDRSLVTLAEARADALLAVADPDVLSVEILNPNPLSFVDWGEDMDNEAGLPDQGIPNTGLLYASADPGTASQQSLHDANLLKIRVHYCYPMVVPVVRTVLAELLGGDADFEGRCYDGGGAPIQATSIMRMQSVAYLSGLAI